MNNDTLIRSYLSFYWCCTIRCCDCKFSSAWAWVHESNLPGSNVWFHPQPAIPITWMFVFVAALISFCIVELLEEKIFPKKFHSRQNIQCSLHSHNSQGKWCWQVHSSQTGCLTTSYIHEHFSQMHCWRIPSPALWSHPVWSILCNHLSRTWKSIVCRSELLASLSLTQHLRPIQHPPFQDDLAMSSQPPKIALSPSLVSSAVFLAINLSMAASKAVLPSTWMNDLRKSLITGLWAFGHINGQWSYYNRVPLSENKMTFQKNEQERLCLRNICIFPWTWKHMGSEEVCWHECSLCTRGDSMYATWQMKHLSDATADPSSFLYYDSYM